MKQKTLEKIQSNNNPKLYFFDQKEYLNSSTLSKYFVILIDLDSNLQNKDVYVNENTKLRFNLEINFQTFSYIYCKLSKKIVIF